MQMDFMKDDIQENFDVYLKEINYQGKWECRIRLKTGVVYNTTWYKIEVNQTS